MQGWQNYELLGAGFTFLAEEISREQAVDHSGFRSHSDVQIIRLLAKTIQVVIPQYICCFPRRLRRQFLLPLIALTPLNAPSVT